jgi:hypothetical protein
MAPAARPDERLSDRKAIGRALRAALLRTGRRIQKASLRRFRSRGIGRAIFGSEKFRAKHAKGLYVTLGKVNQRADGSVDTVVRAKGLAAIAEEGGRFKPHVIVPRRAPRLVFKAAPAPLVAKSVDGFVFATKVQHPGATHPRMPHLAPSVEEDRAQARQDIADAMNRLIDGVK